MARRRYQNPKLHTHIGEGGPQWLIRYSERVLVVKDGRPQMVSKSRWRLLGPKTELTKAQATRMKDEIMRGVNSQETNPIQSGVLFEQFLAVYREQYYRGMKATSQYTYDGRIDKWILPAFTGRKLGQIGALDVTMLLSAMEVAGVARSTRTITRGIISSIFKCARKWGYLPPGAINPATDAEVGRGAGAQREMWTPTMEEAQAIIGHCDAELGLFLETLIWTGMRVSELCGLRCMNVDIEQGIAHIRERNVRGVMDTPKGQTARSNGHRSLPLGYLAATLAPMMGEPEAFLFHRKNGTAHHDKSLTVRMRTAMKAAGLTHLGNLFHAFRRLHANLMKKGMSEWDLQKQMGHKDIATTRLYVGDDFQGRKDALSQVQNNVIPIRRKA